MALLDPLNRYCERTGAELLSEPINAFSNAAFFIAAWLLYKTYRSNGRKDNAILALIIMVAVVGAGSTLFHTFANILTMLCDVIPISVFTLTYLWLVLRRLIGLSVSNTAASLAIFIAAAVGMGYLPEALRFNGSADYFPCLGALFIIGSILRHRHHPSGNTILKAAICFLISITMRSIDYTVCQELPIGTHFLWHTLNGVLLYLLVSAVMIAPQKNR